MLSLCVQGDVNSRQELVASNQSEFMIEALPTRIGRVRKTRDLGEVMECICGQQVMEEDRVRNSEVAIQCGYQGCEPGWVCLLISLTYSQ